MKLFEFRCPDCKFTKELYIDNNPIIYYCPICNKPMEKVYSLGGIKIKDGTRFMDIMRDKEPRKEKE